MFASQGNSIVASLVERRVWLPESRRARTAGGQCSRGCCTGLGISSTAPNEELAPHLRRDLVVVLRLHQLRFGGGKSQPSGHLGRSNPKIPEQDMTRDTYAPQNQRRYVFLDRSLDSSLDPSVWLFAHLFQSILISARDVSAISLGEHEQALVP